jgi:hypothetical protein
MSLMQDVVKRLFGQSKFKRVSVRRSRNIAAGEMTPAANADLFLCRQAVLYVAELHRVCGSDSTVRAPRQSRERLL